MIKMMNKKVVELTVAEVKGMTVAELRNVAKEMGLKGVSKLRKAELVEVILSNLSVNREIREKIEKVEDGLKMKSFGQVVKEMEDKYFEELNGRLEGVGFGDFTMSNGISTKAYRNMFDIINDEDLKVNKDSLISACAELANRSRSYNKAAAHAIVAASAKLEQHAELRFEIDSFIDLDSRNRMHIDTLLHKEAHVEFKPESELFRAVDSEIKVVTDKVSSVANMPVVEKYITLTLGQNLRNVNVTVNGRRDEKASSRKKFVLEQVLDSLLDDTCKNKYTKVRIALKFHRNGLVTPFNFGTDKLNEGEYYREYQYMGVTPSGLRTGSLILGCVAKCEMKNGELILTKEDDRVNLLNRAGSNAFVLNFMEDGNFKESQSKKSLFKGMTRIMQCAPGSEIIDKLHTYVILDNIAKGTKFETKNGQVVDAGDSKDGNTKGAVDSLIDFINATEPDAKRRSKLIKDAKALVGTCDQTRVASSMKASTTWCTRKDLIILFEEIAFRNNNMLTIVVNGQRFDTIYKREKNGAFVKDEKGNKIVEKNAFQQVVEAGLKDDLYKNLQLIGDYNAFKLPKFNPVVSLVRLKKAHTSESATNMVVLMAMLFADLEASMSYLKEKGAKEILKVFTKFGLELDMEDGEIVYNNMNLKNAKSLNNDSQDSQYMFKTAPEAMMEAFPALTKSLVLNDIKAIQRKINELKLDFNSKYTVVQSDDAVLFGQQILAEDEVYCPEFESVKNVSAVRHPISSIFAVTTFKVITLPEILERIYNLNCSNKTKSYLANFYRNVKGYAVLPAYKFLMEKHDGMDWDIDAMQFILEEEAVEILGKLPNIGSEIPDSENWQRESALICEKAIVEEKNYNRPENIDIRPVEKEEKKVSKTLSSMRNNINTKVIYDYSFNCCLSLVKDFFTSPIANVGEIATSFYNNMLLYIVMANKSKDAYTVGMQELIAARLSNKFNCKKERKYQPIVSLEKAIKESQSKGVFKYTSTKIKACEVIWNFNESFGTVEEVRDFLLDCGFFNRYLAETSIDAAKNNYFISNMYKFQDVVKSLGSDKNMKIELKDYNQPEPDGDYQEKMYVSNEEMENTYQNLCKEMGLEEYLEEVLGNNAAINNTFRFPLLFASSVVYTDYQEFFNVAKYKKDLDERLKLNLGVCNEDLLVGVLDPLAEVKLYLLDIANKAIVLSSKILEIHACSEKAQKVRVHLSTPTATNAYKKMNCVFDSVVNAYSTMTQSLKETDDFDGIASANYRKNYLIKALRNFVRIALSDTKKEEVGQAIAAKISSLPMNVKANPALFKLFNEELIVFLKSQASELDYEDLNDLGRIAEPIINLITVEDKALSLRNLEEHLYKTVEINKGIGSINGEDVFFVETKDVKANIKGSIMYDEKLGYYIEGEREYIEDDASVGAIFSTEHVDNLDPTTISDYANFRILTKKDKGVWNKLVAVDSEGNRIQDVASLKMNKETVDLFNAYFEDGLLTGENMSAISATIEYKGEEVEREVIFMNGNVVEKLLEEVQEAERADEFNFNFGTPVDMNEESDLNFTSDDAAAMGQVNDEQEEFNFGLPM